MAYAKKFTIPFKQIKGYDAVDGWVIDIYKDGHGGGSTVLYTERDSIILKRDGGQFEWVNGSKLSFELFNLSEEQYIEFRTASYGDYYCNLKREDGTLVWRGYLQSEIYTEAYDQPPYTAKLEFTCGLSHLKYVRFDDGVGNLYTGQKSLIEVIRLCLNKLEVPLSVIREFVNVYDDSMTSTTTSSMLNQTFVDCTVYREEKDGVEVGFTCHSVLEEIFKCLNVHIFQYDVVWYIIRWQEYEDATMYYRDFNANVGAESTITVDATGSLTTNKRVVTGVTGLSTELVLNNESELSVEPPLNRIKLTYNQDFSTFENMQLIQNGCMQLFTTNAYTGNPTYWTYQGIDPDSYSAIYQAGLLNIFQFNDIDSEAYVSTKYIKQTRENLYISTSDTLRLDMKGYQEISIAKVPLTADYNDINFFLNSGWIRYYPVQIKIGAYYLRQIGTNTGDWVTTPQIFTLVASGCGWSMPFWVDSIDGSVNDYFFLVTDLLPLSGFQDVEMTFFQPYSSVLPKDTLLTDFTINVDAFGLTCASVIYRPDQSAAITDYIVYQEIDEDEEVLNLDIIHGDGLYDFSINSFRLSSGQVTNNWNRRGLTDNLSIFNMILKQYAELRGNFVYNLSATIFAQISPYNTIEHTVNGTDYHYWITDYEYKLETNEWSCNLMQIENFTAIVPDISVTYKYVEEPNVEEIKIDYENTQANNVIANSSVIIADQNEINNFL